MVKIELSDYLRFLRDTKKIRPRSLVIYENAIKKSELLSVDSEDIPSTWIYLRNRLDAKQTAPSYVRTAVQFVVDALSYKGVMWIREDNYHNIRALTRIDKENVPEAYSDEQIFRIWRFTQSDPNLFSAVILCTLAGLRIGGCKNLRYTDFQQVEGVPGVRVFHVFSKNKDYLAAISEYGYQTLCDFNYPHPSTGKRRERVVEIPPSCKTDFETLLRMRLKYKLYDHAMQEELKRKSLWHSMRKWFADQCEAGGLTQKEIGLMLGHSGPKTTAGQYYIGTNKEKVPAGYQRRVAELYARTPLMKFKSGSIIQVNKVLTNKVDTGMSSTEF